MQETNGAVRRKKYMTQPNTECRTTNTEYRILISILIFPFIFATAGRDEKRYETFVLSRVVSSRLVPSRLASPRLASSRLVSSPLVSSRLVSSRLVGSSLV